MATTVNEETLSIEIVETLSFDNDVQSVYDDIHVDIESNIDDIEDYEVVREMKRFLKHELTNKDKVEILNFIKDDYEYELNHTYYPVSIFDNDGIRKGIKLWIEDTFNFDIEEYI